MDVLLCVLGGTMASDREPVNYVPNQQAMPPLGLLYIAQVLVNDGYSVSVDDQSVTGITTDELLSKIVKKADPRVLGVSVYLRNYANTRDLVNRVKAWNPNIKVVAGNYVPTFFPNQLMQEMNVDFCIQGEGEHSFHELVRYIFGKGSDLSKINGLVYRDHDAIKSGPAHVPIGDLDTLPIPDRKLVDFNYHYQHKSTCIMTSRGCPFSCKFCTFEKLMGKCWRPRSAENVLSELQLLKSAGYKDIILVDSNFSLNKKRALTICQGIKHEGLDSMQYSADVRVDAASPVLFRSMAVANFKSVLFGIESGTQRMLDYYKKGITPVQVRLAVEKAREARVETVTGSFVIGGPDETMDEAIATVKFASDLNISAAMIQVLSTTPVSDIYEDLVQRKIYTPRPDDWKREMYVVDMVPGAIPLRRVKSLANEGFIRFWTNPKRRSRYLWNMFIDNSYMRYLVATIENATKNKGGDSREE
jgi:anaerobic magnesium-protoporphyrin IX monomethyl ester cyclase